MKFNHFGRSRSVNEGEYFCIEIGCRVKVELEAIAYEK